MKEAELLSGKVDGRLAYDFAGGRRPAVKLKAERLALKDLGLRLKGEKTELVRVGCSSCATPRWTPRPASSPSAR
jgi:hypothetical protein